MALFQSLDEVPACSEAAPLAEATRRACGLTPIEPLRFRPICTAARATIQQDRLAGADGGQDALLIPLPDDRFAISVDPTPSGGWRQVPQALRAEVRRHRYRFRTGHELAHIFFYRRGDCIPQRNLFDSVEQESFCDSFSQELLVPRRSAVRSKPSLRALMRLQRSYDVSLELAVRALAAAHREAELGLWFLPAGPTDPILQWSTDAKIPGPLEAASRDRFEWLPDRRQFLFLG